MVEIFCYLFLSWVVGFFSAALFVLPFIAGREVRSWASSAASDIRV